MDLLALRHERITRERIGVLATDQHTEPPDLGLYDAQPAAVAIRPDQLLEVSWDQVAVVIDDVAAGTDEEIGIPETADAGVGSFGDAERYHDAVSPGGHPDFCNFGAVEPQRLRGESLEEVVRQDRRLQASPNRKSGN